MKSMSAKLRYLGVSALVGTREYEFVAGDEANQHFTLIVRAADFSSNQLSFQEAPDLCYQKLKAELEAATEMPAGSQIWVTSEDLARYRESHQRAKTLRGRGARQG